jgi:hypothetical protein
MVHERSVDSPFFGEAAKGLADHFRAKHANAFELAYEVVNYVNWKVGEAVIHKSSTQELLLATLLPRSATAFQACVICSERGLKAESMLLGRKVVEVMFRVVAVSKSKTIAERYVRSDEINRRDALKKLQSLEAIKHPPEELRSMEQLYSEVTQKVFDENIVAINTKQFAEAAGLLDWYNTVYAFFSSSAHANIRDLDELFDNDASGEVEAIRYGPEPEFQSMVLSAAIESMVLTLEACNPIFPKGMSGVRQLRRKVVRLAHEVEQRGLT